MATTESMFPDRTDFDYDYETLRTTGVILAVIMFVSGILIALTHPVPKSQRQRCRLKLYREHRLYLKERERNSSREPRQQIHSCAHTRRQFVAIPPMADIPLSPG